MGITVYTTARCCPATAIGAQKIQAPLRPLRHGLAKPVQGIRGLSRGHPHDHQLHPEAGRLLPRQHLHHGLVGWPGVTHVKNGDFGRSSKRPWPCPGSPRTRDKGRSCRFRQKRHPGVAGAVIDAVKAGKIRHFFLVAGCDGAKPGRNYYTEFVERPGRHRDPDPGLRQVPLLRQKAGDIAAPAPSGHRPVQRRLFGHRWPWPWPGPSAAGSTTALSLVLSWYEQKAWPSSDASVPGHQKHPARTVLRPF